jgi:hypothetical protein
MQESAGRFRHPLPLLTACVVALAMFAPAGRASPDPFVGTFAGDGFTLRLTGSAGRYTGVLEHEGRQYAVQPLREGRGILGFFQRDGARARSTRSWSRA